MHVTIQKLTMKNYSVCLRYVHIYIVLVLYIYWISNKLTYRYSRAIIYETHMHVHDSLQCSMYKLNLIQVGIHIGIILVCWTAFASSQVTFKNQQKIKCITLT